MSEPYIATIVGYGFNWAPRGWALCQGQLLSIAQYSAVFSLIGTTYGGNGQTTFALPNLSGRAPIGQGQGPGLTNRQIGQTGGNENTTLLVSNLPQHNHLLNASGQPATTAAPGNAFMAAANGTDDSTGNPVTVHVYGPTANETMNPNAIGMAGGSVPFNNMQPFLTINFSFALEGIFPSRN